MAKSFRLELIKERKESVKLLFHNLKIHLNLYCILAKYF
ncbi:hypothetical protein A1OE_433 [Candidatus Endolissoclinum faulkneri L2]|uniref:Uncharacterized protein n=1 Tax=Candidatus Endolissoclinum faulkneri L2 TaxID=1193729 RepID=K7ZCI9_9PROT|nr:hypothetical protein A1OE_433 [Candidatus Endolissoclinum faulkneri L2]